MPQIRKSPATPELDHPKPRILATWADRLEVILPLIGYALVSLIGASTSSIGIAALRGAHPKGLMFGTPLPIRSDEYLTAAPIELSVLAHGKSTSSLLSHGPDLIYQTSSGGVFESILFLEGNLLRLGPFLPDAMLFAAFRAFPILLLLLFLPPLLRRFGANRSMSWLGVVLTLLAPASLWWSFMPIRVLAFAVTGSYLLILARDRFERRSWWLFILYAVTAGGAIARLGTYYVPWGLTIGIPLVAATAAFLLASGLRWRAVFATLAMGACSSIFLFGATMLENLSDLRSELDTVYPGLRRSTGEAMSPGKIFSAPGLPWTTWLHDPDPAVTNRSEIATAYSFILVWVLLIWLFRHSTLPREQKWVTGVLAGFAVLWTSWIMLDWGSVGARIPFLAVVMPVRSAETIGYLAAILLCLVLSQLEQAKRWQVAAVAALGCFLITAYGVSDLQRYFTDLTAPQIWLSTVVTSIAVLVITRWPDHWAPTTALAVVLGLLAATVNPVILGLGDLRDSKGAREVQRMSKVARAESGWLVSNDPNTNSLMVANGAPTLTGFQVTGPVAKNWELLDPTRRNEEYWNRGASYIRMDFTEDPAEPTFSNPSRDVIQVVADPCEVTRRIRLSYVLSNRPLINHCLIPKSTFKWGGTRIHTYRVQTP